MMGKVRYLTQRQKSWPALVLALSKGTLWRLMGVISLSLGTAPEF